MILVNEVPSHAIMPASEVRSERDSPGSERQLRGQGPS